MSEKMPSRPSGRGWISEARIALGAAVHAWWPAILLVVAGFAVAYHFVEPAPPRSIVIAAGAEDGAYFAFAQRYREVLARSGVHVQVRATSGSVENFRLLRDEGSDVDAGFVQGGIGDPAQAPDLTSLGAMYYEPVWIFYRGGAAVPRLTEFKERRIAIGPEGSGTRQLAGALLSANGIEPPHGDLSNLTGNAAADALRAGRLDMVVLVASPKAPAVEALLRDARIRLMSFERADAYAVQFPFLTVVTLPRGGIDLGRDLPPADVKLVATTANLVARGDLHPAIAVLLAAAAKEVHGVRGLFNGEDEFPSLRNIDFPKNAEAVRYYRSGPPFLQRYLPFWAAVLVDRMMVLLVPAIALLIPLLRAAPALYNWRVSSRIYRHYGELKFLEQDLEQAPAPERIAEYLARLDTIESRVNRLHIPLAFHEHLYTLRSHIDLVRARIARLRAAS